jgi:hypothetical protein
VWLVLEPIFHKNVSHNKLIFLRSLLQLLVTANVVPSSLIRFILMMEVTRSSATSVLKRTTQRHIPEDDIHPSHRRENPRNLQGRALFSDSFMLV